MGGVAEDGHRSGVLAHNLMCYGQSEARAAFLSREEGIEDPFRILLDRSRLPGHEHQY